jgi:hypothetical protein
MHHHSPRIRRNVSTPNLRVVVDNFGGGRGRSRGQSPVIVERLYDETVGEDFDDFDYRLRAARNISRGREEFSHGYGLYGELPSTRLPRPGSRGHLFREPQYVERERPSFRGPSYESPSYEMPSFDGPSFDRHSYEWPSHVRGQLQIENEEQVNSRTYESGKRNIHT